VHLYQIILWRREYLLYLYWLYLLSFEFIYVFKLVLKFTKPNPYLVSHYLGLKWETSKKDWHIWIYKYGANLYTWINYVTQCIIIKLFQQKYYNTLIFANIFIKKNCTFLLNARVFLKHESSAKFFLCWRSTTTVLGLYVPNKIG
jgi:hypothetical protein